MVLKHVAQHAGAVVVRAAVVHALGLGHGDLHVVDQIAVPQRLERDVGEAEHQDVLHRLLSQVMVDAEHLRLVEGGQNLLIEGARRRQIAPERFLDDHASPAPAAGGPPAGETGLQQPVDRLRVEPRRQGEIVETSAPVTRVRERRGDGGETRTARDVPLRVMDGARELAPGRALRRCSAGAHRGLEQVEKSVLGELGARHTQDARAGGEPPLAMQPEQGGDQLAGGKTAGGAEDDQRGSRQDPDLLIAWPPNCWRMAARTRSANDPC